MKISDDKSVNIAESNGASSQLDESTQTVEETAQAAEPTQAEGQTSTNEQTVEPTQVDKLATVQVLIEEPTQVPVPVEVAAPFVAFDGEVAGFIAEDGPTPSWRSRLRAPTREEWLIGIAFWSVILLGAVLRFWGLGDRPLHHDESMHAYFSMNLLHTTIENWKSCFDPNYASACYSYDPLLHGPFQFHAIALVYQISQWLHAPDNGFNNTTARIMAAILGSALVALPYLVRKHMGNLGAWLACFLLAVSPSLVYFSRFTREDIYMAFFTLLLVVCLVRYMSSRQMKWLIWAAVAFALSYATKEATFLTVGIFGSFFGAVLAWELGARTIVRDQLEESSIWRSLLPRTASPLFLLVYFAVCGVLAKWFFGELKNLAEYVANDKNKPVADAFVANLKNSTMAVIPFIGVALGFFVIYKLVRELMSAPGNEYMRRGIARWLDEYRQPWLDTFLTMPWIHWLFALICGWMVFLVLFTSLFTKLSTGVSAGIWQGLYYWLQQQQVARGGQPWYYYLLLIPLYEQIGVVFSLFGIVRCLLRPTRFRLFLVYWYIGTFFIYSWAAEKMPWLTIHIAIPMLLLAALGLEPAILTLVNFVKSPFSKVPSSQIMTAPVLANALRRSNRPGVPAVIGAGLLLLLAVLLLVSTLQNMYQVTYVHAADAGHEMMIYVQTSDDVKIVMDKIDTLDQKLYQGQHKLGIGVSANATWPFAWYLRDYPSTCFNFPASQAACPDAAKNPEVIISAGPDMAPAQAQFATAYSFKQYRMRVQWDQGYMPPQCVPSATNPCTDPQPYTGVGPFMWLAYGDDPPIWAYNQPCVLADMGCFLGNIGRDTIGTGLAIQHIWQWWWQRKPFGDPNGSFDMGLMIRNDLPVAP